MPLWLIPVIVIGALVVLAWWRTFLVRRGHRHPLTRTSLISLRSDPTSAFDLAKSTVKAMGLSVISLDQKNATIVASKRGTWRGFGEFLQIDVSPNAGGECQLSCKSWPTSDLAVLDWGAGRRLIANFIYWLKSAAPEEALVASTPINRLRHQ